MNDSNQDNSIEILQLILSNTLEKLMYTLYFVPRDNYSVSQ